MNASIRDLRGVWQRLPARGLPWLAPLGWLYGLGAWIDGSLKGAGAERCGKPVISVGNLEAGGTGKTPLTLALVDLLRASGRRPGVLTGLWGPGRKRGLLRETDADFPALAPDEALMFAARLPDLPLVAARRKWRGALALAEDARCDLILVDDGFQHRRLDRNLDLVLLSDASALSTNRILPAGSLREFPGALGRADLLLLPEGARAPDRSTAPIQRFRRARGALRELGGGVAMLAGAGTIVASGIARPEGFEAAAAALCAEAGSPLRRILRFGDHAALDARVASAIGAELARHPGARLLCTEKDARRWASSWGSKLSQELPLYLELVLELADPSELVAFLTASLD